MGALLAIPEIIAIVEAGSVVAGVAEAATVATVAEGAVAGGAEVGFGAWYATTFAGELAAVATASETSAAIGLETAAIEAGTAAITAEGAGALATTIAAAETATTIAAAETATVAAAEGAVMEVVGTTLVDQMIALDNTIVLGAAPAEQTSLGSIIGGLLPTKKQVIIGAVTYAGSKVADDVISELTKPPPSDSDNDIQNDSGIKGLKAFPLSDVLTTIKDVGVSIINEQYGTKTVFNTIDRLLKSPESFSTSLNVGYNDMPSSIKDEGEFIKKQEQINEIDAFEMGRRAGKVAGNLIENLGVQDVTTETLSNAVLKTATADNREISLKLYEYIRKSEEFTHKERYTEKFSEIYKVYTGDISEPYYIDGVIYVNDEWGTPVKNSGNNTGIVLRPLYGEYVGMLSPNQKAPIDIVDAIAFLHDVDYDQMGTFSPVADMRMISRLAHVFPTLNLKQKLMARFMMGYFSTGGVIMSSFLGKSGTGNLFNYLGGSKGIQLSGARGWGIGATGKTRSLFDAGLKLGYAEAMTLSLNTYGVPTTPESNAGILEAFDNILVYA